MGRNKGSKDGYNIYCKACIRLASQKQRDLNPEQNRMWQLAYAQKNRKEKSAKDLKRYYSKKEEILIKNAEYRKLNHEARLEIERASRAKNKQKNRPSKNARQSIRNKLASDSKYVIIYKDLKRIYSQPCLNCGTNKNQSLDHKIPLSRGGEHKIGNIMTLCQPCNASKNAKTIMEWKLAKIKKGDG
jgi:5-methylcytosine-specific restriction endonuclease McrA